MSLPVLLPNGALCPDLVNNAAFVKCVNGGGPNDSTASGTGERGQRVSVSEDFLREKERSFTEAFHAGKWKIHNLTDSFTRSSSAETETENNGQTVVQNKPMGVIVGKLDYSATYPWQANQSAADGAPTHGFLFQNTGFLMEATKEYTVLKDNEVFQHRNINDTDFIRDTLDFFTNGNYTNDDVRSVKNQVAELVRELARQLNEGGSGDISKLQTKLTTGGEDMTIS